jgi:hypothetical protein
MPGFATSRAFKDIHFKDNQMQPACRPTRGRL